MRIKQIKQELTAAGISTSGIFEKEELVQLLIQHRATAAAAAPGDAAAKSPTPTPTVVVDTDLPLIGVGGLMYIDAVSGSRTLRLLVDTGASTSVLGAAEVAALGLVAGPDGKAAVPLEFGGARVTASCIVQQGFLPPGVAGILGLDVMLQWASLELDLTAGIARLRTTAPEPPDTTVPMPFRPVSLGLLPFVGLELRGKGADSDEGLPAVCRCEGLVDTGSPVTIVTPSASAAAGAVRGDVLQDMTATGVDGTPTKMEAMVCEELVVGEGPGGWTQIRAPIQSGKPGMMSLVGMGEQQVALLGLDVLCAGARTVVMDWAGKRLWRTTPNSDEDSG